MPRTAGTRDWSRPLGTTGSGAVVYADFHRKVDQLVDDKPFTRCLDCTALHSKEGAVGEMATTWAEHQRAITRPASDLGPDA